MGKRKRKKKVRPGQEPGLSDQTCEVLEEVSHTSELTSSSSKSYQQSKFLSVLSGRENLFCFIILTILLYLTYGHSLPAPFLFDDVKNITGNQAIQIEGVDIDSLGQLINESLIRTRPIANISFAINHLFHRDDPFAYRFVNIIIHLLNGCLLFYFLRLTFALPVHREKINHPLELALWVTFIWIVHPLHVQSVTYIVQRMNSMATMFYMLSFILYIKGRLAESENRKWLLFTIAFIAFVMGLGSKEIVITLPVFVLVYEWYFFQDLKRSFLTKNLRALFAGTLLILVMALIYTDGSPLQKMINGYVQRDFTLMQRVWTEPRVILHYIDLFLFPSPHRLTLLHEFEISRSMFKPMSTLPAFLFLNGLVIISAVIAKKHRLLSFCLLWFFGNLVLESSFIGLEIIFEHRTYLPSMLLGVMLILLYHRKVPIGLSRAVLAIVLVVFSSWTFQRNSTWLNSVEFWQDNLKKNPLEARTYFGVGQALEERGDIKTAIHYYEQATTLTKDKLSAYNILGSAQAKAGQLADAVETFETALELAPEYPETNYNIAMAFSELGYFSDAIRHYEIAQKNGTVGLDSDIHNNLGIMFSKTGKTEKAIDHFNASLKINPNQSEAHNNLGVVYIWQKNYRTAAQHFRKALQFNENDPVILNRLGAALMYLGHYKDAYDLFNQALEINPGFQPARESLRQLRGKL